MKKNTATVFFMLLTLFVTCGSAIAAPSWFTQSATPENVITSVLQNRYTLTITNRSKYDIKEVYVETSENQSDWGKEWLAGRILKTDTFIAVDSLKPGEYDVKFIDEDKYECVLHNIAITKNTSWALTTAWLEKCEGFGK
jgi:hypothetical protein